LTEHVLYVSRVVQHTITIQMAEEAQVLLRFQMAQERVKEVVEMPDPAVNRIIRSIRENGSRISGKLLGEYPRLGDKALAGRLVEAVRSAFEDESASV